MKSNTTKYSFAFGLLSLAGVCIPLQAGEKLVELESRPGVTQKFILIKPENPTAAVVLIPGGRATLKLKKGFSGPSINPKYAISFIVEARKEFANKNLMVALIDAPSDQQMSWRWRVGEEHADDLKAVIAYLKKQADVPVWLVGSSNASLSAANYVSRFGNGDVHGLAIGAAMTNITPDNKFGPGFSETHREGAMSVGGLDKFSGPVLVYWHKDDKCILSPPADAPRFAGKFTGSKKVEVKYIERRASPLSHSDPCLGGSIHDLQGVENEASEIMINFILDNSSPARTVAK